MSTLVEAFENPIHPSEVRQRLHDLEQQIATLHEKMADDRQRLRMMERIVLMLGHEEIHARKPIASDSPAKAIDIPAA